MKEHVPVREMRTQRLANEEPYPRVAGKFWPSDFWSCHRQKYYQYKGYASERDLPKGIFEAGDAVEEQLLRELRAYYGDIYVLPAVHIVIDGHLEPRFREAGIRVSGKTDPVVLGENGRIRLVYECKGKGRVYGNDKPSEHHKRQLTAYLKALKPEEGGVLYYANRADYEQTAENRIQFDPETWDSVVSWVLMQHHYQEKDEVPPPSPYMDWSCGYCDFAERCRKEGPEDLVRKAFKRSRKKYVPLMDDEAEVSTPEASS